MTKTVTFGEWVAAGVVFGVLLGAILLTALGNALPQEVYALLLPAFGYILGSRTSQPA